MIAAIAAVALRKTAPASALVLLLVPPLRAADETAPIAIAEEFAARIEQALAGGPVSWDRLWSPAARDSSLRALDVRASALFTWTGVDVRIDSTSVRSVPAPSAGTSDSGFIEFVARTTGTATWDSRAYGVATSLWRPLHDEARETNRVSRREAWRVTREGGEWRAVERAPLSPVHVRDLAVRASVFPRQDVILVESTFSLVAEIDGLEDVRFFLDRRVEIYDLLVNDRAVDVERGSELGSLGLEGFSPENESSFRVPRSLARGEEILVKFRTRSPLVHLRGPGFVTTLPLHSGAFRERAWYPLFGGELDREARDSRVDLEVAWSKGAFKSAFLSGESAERDASPWPEEESAHSRPSRPRSIDFLLLETGADAEDVFDVLRGARGNDPRVVEGGALRWVGGEEAAEPYGSIATAVLDPHPRSRRALVAPLATLSTASSRDLTSELQEVLPLDAQIVDELFDDAETSAESGADDRASE